MIFLLVAGYLRDVSPTWAEGVWTAEYEIPAVSRGAGFITSLGEQWCGFLATLTPEWANGRNDTRQSSYRLLPACSKASGCSDGYIEISSNQALLDSRFHGGSHQRFCQPRSALLSLVMIGCQELAYRCRARKHTTVHGGLICSIPAEDSSILRIKIDGKLLAVSVSTLRGRARNTISQCLYLHDLHKVLILANRAS